MANNALPRNRRGPDGTAITIVSIAHYLRRGDNQGAAMKEKIGLFGMGMVVGAAVVAVMHRGVAPATDWMLIAAFAGAWMLATDKVQS